MSKEKNNKNLNNNIFNGERKFASVFLKLLIAAVIVVVAALIIVLVVKNNDQDPTNEISISSDMSEPDVNTDQNLNAG